MSANRVAVNRVVNRAVADTAFLHIADNLLKSVKIFGWVAVKLNIRNMTAVCKMVVRCFNFDFFEGCNIVINRNVEGVCIIFSVCNTGNNSETLRINFYKSALKSQGRS